MTSWVISIDQGHPQHWAIAKQHRFWDMTANYKIMLGDNVYFWQGGGSLLSQAIATSSTFPIDSTAEKPWEDSGQRIYKSRFEFHMVSEQPSSQPAWGDIRKRLSQSVAPQVPRAFEAPADEEVLASYFPSDVTVGGAFDDEERSKELERFGFDLRVFDMRAIARRQGQPGDCRANGVRGVHLVTASRPRACGRRR